MICMVLAFLGGALAVGSMRLQAKNDSYKAQEEELQAQIKEERVGAYDTCLTPEFFRAFATHAGLTLHLKAEYGENAHHILEALFKAAAHALCDATAENSTGAVLSTKGTLSE